MKSRFLYMLPPIIGVTLLGSSCGSSATQASSPRISAPSTQGRPTAAAVATKSAASTQSGPAAPSCPLPVDFAALAKLRGVKKVVSGDAAAATFQLPFLEQPAQKLGPVTVSLQPEEDATGSAAQSAGSTANAQKVDINSPAVAPTTASGQTLRFAVPGTESNGQSIPLGKYLVVADVTVGSCGGGMLGSIVSVPLGEVAVS